MLLGDAHILLLSCRVGLVSFVNALRLHPSGVFSFWQRNRQLSKLPISMLQTLKNQLINEGFSGQV